MKTIKWIFTILFGLLLILVVLVFIDVSPYYNLISTEDPTPSPFQSPDQLNSELRSDIVFLSASEMAQKIREKELTSLEVIEAHLNQIYLFNPKINALVTVNAEAALKRAKEADSALNQGKVWGPLHGVPFTVKDHLATKSVRTTSGYGPLKDFVPDYDATVVTRLKESGAILLGKTNMPPLGACCGTTNLIFGTTNNPWDLNRTVGGSAGGSAAALISGMTPIEIGSDGGGSIRIPAHYTGVFGMKPTENLISFYGASFPGIEKLIPKIKTLNTVRHLKHLGPMARSIEDLELLIKILKGPDINDANILDLPDYEPDPKPLNKLKIAWTISLPGRFLEQETNKISLESRNLIKIFINKLSDAGVILEQNIFPTEYMNKAYKTWGDLVSMEYDFHLPVIHRILAKLSGNPYTVLPYTYEKYQHLLNERDEIISFLNEKLSKFDVLILPVTLNSAYKHLDSRFEGGMLANYFENVSIDGKNISSMTVDFSYNVLFNLTGNPVVVIPIGFTQSGLPIGIQIVGKKLRDAELLIVAQQLFNIGGDFRIPPKFIK